MDRKSVFLILIFVLLISIVVSAVFIFPEWCGWEGPAFVVDNYIRHNDRFEMCQIYISPLNFGYALIRKVKAQ